MLIWIILFLTISIDSSLLTLEDSNVVTLYNYIPPIYINSITYRESVLHIVDEAIFSLNMKPGKYSINDSDNSINDSDNSINVTDNSINDTDNSIKDYG